MKLLTRLVPSLVAIAILTGMSKPADAETNYPTRTIKIVVPYVPGITDSLARIIAQKLSDSFGEAVIVDNRPGAGGLIGADYVAKSTADGYTLLMGSAATHAINPSLFSKMPYDVKKDFVSISLAATYPNVLLVNPSVPAQSMAELIALAKKKPGGLSYASTGSGGTSHLSAEMFKMMTGTEMVHIPYKGGGAAIPDLISGQVQVMFDSVGNSMPRVKAGKLRALGITSAKRSPLAPELATLQEQGLDGFEAIAWNGLHAPAGTPRSIVDKLNAEIVKILNMPDVRKRFADLGAETGGNTPEQFDAFINAEIAKWAKVIEKSGARAN